MLSTIIVPLDGSDFAARALPHATALARSSGAKLVLMRVLPEHGPGKQRRRDGGGPCGFEPGCRSVEGSWATGRRYRASDPSHPSRRRGTRYRRSRAQRLRGRGGPCDHRSRGRAAGRADRHVNPRAKRARPVGLRQCARQRPAAIVDPGAARAAACRAAPANRSTAPAAGAARRLGARGGGDRGRRAADRGTRRRAGVAACGRAASLSTLRPGVRLRAMGRGRRTYGGAAVSPGAGRPDPGQGGQGHRAACDRNPGAGDRQGRPRCRCRHRRDGHAWAERPVPSGARQRRHLGPAAGRDARPAGAAGRHAEGRRVADSAVQHLDADQDAGLPEPATTR